MSKMGPGDAFTKIKQVACQELIKAKSLDRLEKAILFDLLPFVAHGSNIVSNNVGPMSIEEIASLVALSDRQTLRCLQGLEVKKLLVLRTESENTKVVALNKQYFVNGH